MTNLKPCPFCDGEAELCYGPGLGTDSCRGYTLYAGCNECGAKSPGLWQEKKPEPSDPIWEDVAEEWNYRPGEIDVTKCGVAYCERHREGLPYCVECREESTLAHDKACALLADARADAEQLKQLWSCNLDIIGGELNKQLAEARARIDILERAHNDLIEEQAAICAEGQSIAELIAAKDKQLAEAQAEIVELKRGAGSDTGTIVRQANSIGVMDKQLAETRAEIENLQWRVSEERAKTEAALELNDRALELVNEARADAEHWKAECNSLQRMVHEARAEIERLKSEHEDSLRRAKDNAVSLSGTVTEYAGELLVKDKLIEQMREALRLALPEARSTHCENTIKAALAAERGEG